MAVIDRDNFIVHLIWSGLVDDEATCGELREAVELCTVKDTYTKTDVITILTELQQYIGENVLADNPDTLVPFLQARETCVAVIQQKINELKGNANGNDN